jgi:hypothetical protein
MHVRLIGKSRARVSKRWIARRSNQVKDGLALEVVFQVPIQRHRVAEPSTFQEFLPLKQHGNAGSSEDQACSQGGSLLSIVMVRIARIDFRRNSRFAVSHLIMRLAVHDSLKRIAVIGEAEGIAHGRHRAIAIVGANHRCSNRMNEVRIPLCSKTSAPQRESLVSHSLCCRSSAIVIRPGK